MSELNRATEEADEDTSRLANSFALCLPFFDSRSVRAMFSTMHSWQGVTSELGIALHNIVGS
jgi:hypothetical protein